MFTIIVYGVFMYNTKMENLLNEVSYRLNNVDVILKKVPKNYRANLYKGQVCVELKEYEDAVRYFEEAKKVDIKTFKSYNLLGISYHAIKQYDKAIECFNETLKITPNSFKAYNLLGISYFEKKRLY